MKIAIPMWGGRISPVFDVARRILVVDVQDSTERVRYEETLYETQLPARARRLAALGVDVLICGAVSQALESMVLSQGIRVIPQICGEVKEVLQASLSGRLQQTAFLMPGCRGQRRRIRRRRAHGRSRREGWSR